MRVSEPPTSSNLVRWGGLAAALGGVLWVLKGGLIMLGAPDPDLLIPAELLFALGLLGLHARLAGRGGWPEKIGGLLAYVALSYSTPCTNISSCPSTSGPLGGPNL